MSRPLLAVAAALLAQSVAPAQAQNLQHLPYRSEATSINDERGAVVPERLRFVDETGAAVEIGRYFTGERPVVLNLGYFGCPALCGVVLNGLVRGLRGLEMDPGTDFEIVTVSIDPNERPALARQKKSAALREYARPGAEDHWHFLTGREEQIRALADTVGFGYRWNEHGDQFDHGAGLILLTPAGEVHNYLFGAEFAPRDLRLAVVEASEGKVGNVWDRILLSCYGYDPTTRTYSLMIMNVLRVFGVVLVLAVGGMILFLWRRERRRRLAPATS